MDAPVRDQLMLERFVVAAVDHGVENHGADGELLHPSPRQQRGGVALGEAAAQIGGRVGARDLVEQIADVGGFHQMFIGCHRSIMRRVDILSVPKKDGDSLSRRSMSRTEEDIASGVDITIMRDATLSTYPASYSEVCDTFRPRLAGARRTDSGKERFIPFLVPSPVLRRFIAEHVSEESPACIKNRLRQAGLGESGGIHVADRDVIELSNEAGRELVVKIPA